MQIILYNLKTGDDLSLFHYAPLPSSATDTYTVTDHCFIEKNEINLLETMRDLLSGQFIAF